MPRKPHTPSLCHHKGTSQGYVTLNGVEHYLGFWPAGEDNPPPAVQAEYDQLIARWLSHGRRLPTPEEEAVEKAGHGGARTVNDLILAYIVFAEGYYQGGEKSKELACIKDALRILKELWGRTPAAEFVPKRLKKVREMMLTKDWCRTYTNHQINRVKRMFGWAAGEDLIPGTVYHSLLAVKGLRKGTPGIRESRRVRPAPSASIKAVLPHVPPMVRAMIRFQRLTGCRPGEVCRLKPRRIQQAGGVWIYRPGKHKTAHLGKKRRIFIGPQAQKVLEPWLKDLDPNEYVFSPSRGEALRRAERRAKRKTPLWSSHLKHQALKRKEAPKRSARNHYDTASYRRVIKRACRKVKVQPWSPGQLRHNAATRIRKQFGIEMARIILGHSTAFTTEIYAEKDMKQAAEIMGKIG